MRSRATWLVVAAVVAVGLAAGFDALRDEETPDPAAATEPETRSVSTTSEDVTTTVVPLEEQLAGTLYYTDAACKLQAVELPGPRPAEAPNWDECRFVLSPDGHHVAGAGSGWDPHSDPLRGRLFESGDGRIQVSTNGGPEGPPFRGSGPAWRPDGTLTYFDRGAVRSWPDGDVLLSQDDLAEAVLAHPDVPDNGHVRPVTVRELAWLGPGRLVALVDGVVRAGPPQSLLAFYDARRLTAVSFGGDARLSDLGASPQGGLVAVRSDDDLLLLNARGDALPAPRFSGYRAIAFSDDDQWAAVATDAGVVVFRPGSTDAPALTLDLDARDLDWRGQVGPGALASADRTRSWLGGVGVAGRLFVTQADGSGCVLRALRIADLDWAEQPPGLPNPCRFRLDDDGSVVGEAVAPQPGGDRIATCRDGGLDVFDGTGSATRRPGACAPAWTPDGRLTFLRDGELYEEERPLLTRAELGRIFGRPSALEEVAWLDDERFWAVVRSGPDASLALLTADGLVFSPPFSSRAIDGLEVSSTGMVAARSDDGVVLFDSGGRRAMSFPGAHAVAWAPGELVAAVATPNEVLFVAPVSREVVTLPLAVRDLAWSVP